MDDATVKYTKERYEECKRELEGLLKTVGYNVTKINFIPTSGWLGDNLKIKSKNTPWYTGPTLFEALDAFVAPPNPLDTPLLVPIQDVYALTGVSVVPVGRIETGILSEHDNVDCMQ